MLNSEQRNYAFKAHQPQNSHLVHLNCTIFKLITPVNNEVLCTVKLELNSPKVYVQSRYGSAVRLPAVLVINRFQMDGRALDPRNAVRLLNKLSFFWDLIIRPIFSFTIFIMTLSFEHLINMAAM